VWTSTTEPLVTVSGIRLRLYDRMKFTLLLPLSGEGAAWTSHCWLHRQAQAQL
jgi:hypothetical protein